MPAPPAHLIAQLAGPFPLDARAPTPESQQRTGTPTVESPPPALHHDTPATGTPHRLAAPAGAGRGVWKNERGDTVYFRPGFIVADPWAGL